MAMTTPSAPPRLELVALPGVPEVAAGTDLAALVADGLAAAGLDLRDGDVLVLAQKIVSKAEGRRVALDSVQPSPRALEVAASVRKDARLVELILAESRRIVRQRPDVLIVEHRLGFVMANAGVDQSNVAGPAGCEVALLLPQDPDASAAGLREALAQRLGVRVAVIVNDSFGRPWRRGSVGVAIGCAGMPALRDMRGLPDRQGRRLRVTEVALADELAAAASLLMGQAAEGLPIVRVRGAVLEGAEVGAAALVRAATQDLFR